MEDGMESSAMLGQRRDALLASVAIQPSGEAWKEWLDLCPDLEGLSPTELRLLPFVFQELRRSGQWDQFVQLPTDIAGRLQGLHRKMWYHNKVRMKWGQSVCQQFEDKGIDSLIFKGMQLLKLWSWDPGTRPTRDVDIWVRPSQFHAAENILKSEEGMVVKDKSQHSTTFIFQNMHSLDLHRMPHHLGDRYDNESRFEQAFARRDDRIQAMVLLLSNAFVNDAPDQFVGLYTLVDWHRSGVPWMALAPQMSEDGLRPVVAAHLAQFPAVVNASPLLSEARRILEDRGSWSLGERALDEAIQGWRQVRANDPPWSFHHWRWTLQGYSIWQRDLKSVNEILHYARVHRTWPFSNFWYYRSRRRQNKR